jgi:hypothetical protein
MGIGPGPGIATERSMSKLPKPFPSIVVLRCQWWFALAVIAALAGVAFWRMTWGEVALFVLCWGASFAAFPNLVGVLQTCSRQINPMVLACALLVVLIVTVTVALVAIASPILIAPAPNLTGAPSAAVRFE